MDFISVFRLLSEAGAPKVGCQAADSMREKEREKITTQTNKRLQKSLRHKKQQQHLLFIYKRINFYSERVCEKEENYQHLIKHL